MNSSFAMKIKSSVDCCVAPDLSGSMQGAGGVGGLLAVKLNETWYAPLYDANGNITAYVSENGDTVATYEYDAFGATISQSGAMADSFRHRFSTKPWIAALGAYDYGERLYSPTLRRWLSRDPIEEEGGVNLYAMCGNNPVDAYDELGLWTATAESAGQSRRVYKFKDGDTMESLAKIVGLDPKEYRKWGRVENSAKAENGSSGKITSPSSPGCYVSVPNVWISADLLRGGNWYYDSFVNFGGTIGRLVGTDVFTSSDHKVVKADDIKQLSAAFRASKGDIWGIVVFGHGNKKGELSMTRRRGEYEKDWTFQSELIVGIREGGYKIAHAYMMQCYSAFKGLDEYGKEVDYGAEWRKVAVRFHGYKGTNAFLIDLGSGGKITRRIRHGRRR